MDFLQVELIFGYVYANEAVWLRLLILIEVRVVTSTILT